MSTQLADPVDRSSSVVDEIAVTGDDAESAASPNLPEKRELSLARRLNRIGDAYPAHSKNANAAADIAMLVMESEKGLRVRSTPPIIILNGNFEEECALLDRFAKAMKMPRYLVDLSDFDNIGQVSHNMGRRGALWAELHNNGPRLVHLSMADNPYSWLALEMMADALYVHAQSARDKKVLNSLFVIGSPISDTVRQSLAEPLPAMLPTMRAPFMPLVDKILPLDIPSPAEKLQTTIRKQGIELQFSKAALRKIEENPECLEFVRQKLTAGFLKEEFSGAQRIDVGRLPHSDESFALRVRYAPVPGV